MQWFGQSWGAPVNSEGNWVTTPENERCPECDRKIYMGDRGVILPHIAKGDLSLGASWYAFHLNCWLRMVLGPETAKLVIVDD